MATLYYLQWDRNPNSDASDFFSKINGLVETDELTHIPRHWYSEVATDQEVTVENAFRKWNNGSGYESELFQTLLYCDRCDEQIASKDEARQHAEKVHGEEHHSLPDEVHEASLPSYIHRYRSLTAGDIVEDNGTLYLVAPIGFSEVEWTQKDHPQPESAIQSFN